MIAVTIEKRYGAATVRARVSATTIERAVEMAGAGARLVLPIEGETFFAPVEKEGIAFERMSLDELEAAYEVGLPGAYEAYREALQGDMGPDAAEAHALGNCLI